MVFKHIVRFGFNELYLQLDLYDSKQFGKTFNNINHNLNIIDLSKTGINKITSISI